MRTQHDLHVDTTVLDAAALLALAMSGGPTAPAGSLGRASSTAATTAPFGAWRSADGAVRLDIKTDGTYAGKIAGRKRAAHGTYRVDGSMMTLRDDDGLPTPVTLYDGRLEMAGHHLAPA